MDRERYASYLDCFNRGDFAHFGDYYADDIVFVLGDLRSFHGLDELTAFYKEVKGRVRETQTALQVVIDEGGVAAELDSTFLALEDWPEFVSGPLKKGDVYRRRGLIMYTLRDGKFSYIRSGRQKVLESPWAS